MCHRLGFEPVITKHWQHKSCDSSWADVSHTSPFHLRGSFLSLLEINFLIQIFPPWNYYHLLMSFLIMFDKSHLNSFKQEWPLNLESLSYCDQVRPSNHRVTELGQQWDSCAYSGYIQFRINKETPLKPQSLSLDLQQSKYHIWIPWFMVSNSLFWLLQPSHSIHSGESCCP